MTDAKELERVRYIHSILDAWQSVVETSPHDTFTMSTPGDVALSYTRAEVRAWPEVKAAMYAMAKKYTSGAFWKNGNAYWTTFSERVSPAGQEAIARGLCLYREMLTPSSPAKEGCTHLPTCLNNPCPDCGACLDCFCCPSMPYCAIRARKRRSTAPSESKPESPAVKGIDPASDAPPEFKEACRVFNKQNGPRKWDRDSSAVKDAAAYQQLSTLDKRIAAARAEMALSSEERRRKLHPHPGRNFALTKRDGE